MRISDWSSDVCSSDLADGDLHCHPRAGPRLRLEEGSPAMAVTPDTASPVSTTDAPDIPSTPDVIEPETAPLVTPSIPVIPGEHPNEAPRLTPVELLPGKALYKQALPGVMQVPLDLDRKSGG